MRFLIIPVMAFVFTAVFVFLSKKLAQRFRIYDYPDSKLSIHQIPIPLLGGVGIFVAVLITLTISFLFILNPKGILTMLAVFVGGVLSFLLGLWDDLNWKRIFDRITYKQKFIFQLATSIVIAVVLSVGGLSIKITPLGVFGVLFVAFFILGAMNALNLQDGLDGLAAGMVAVSTAGFTVLSVLSGNNFGLILSLAGMGGALGFLVYNFNPASIFMGDNGSHFLGFFVAVLAIIFISRPYDLRWFIGPVLIIGFPVFDCAWAIFRRIIKRKNIFKGDRGHLYDRMIQKGISVRGTVLLCYLIQVVFVAGGVSLTQL